jgi:hypothetical protein
MSNQETIKGIREQLKAIKEAITVIEFKLSQLESEGQPLSARSQQPACCTDASEPQQNSTPGDVSRKPCIEIPSSEAFAMRDSR